MTTQASSEILEQIQELQPQFARFRTELKKVIVGQDLLLEKVLVGLLAGGHILLEGVPGLAKTLTFHTMATVLSASFQRIQFTPDLLPADLIGTQIYNPAEQSFAVRKGPIFANLVLADEINRAPAKVQSALLEAMAEQQVTIGETSFSLPDPFLVMATQNPIEQEGTYRLPEAQLDRFMLKLHVSYPSRSEEREILDRMTAETLPKAEPIFKVETLAKVKKLIPHVFIDDKVKDYIINIVFATRDPRQSGIQGLEQYIEQGASPRATIALTKASQARAVLEGRDYVTPDDIKWIAHDILRHRIIPSYEAEADEVNSDTLLSTMLNTIEVP